MSGTGREQIARRDPGSRSACPLHERRRTGAQATDRHGRGEPRPPGTVATSVSDIRTEGPEGRGNQHGSCRIRRVEFSNEMVRMSRRTARKRAAKFGGPYRSAMNQRSSSNACAALATRSSESIASCPKMALRIPSPRTITSSTSTAWRRSSGTPSASLAIARTRVINVGLPRLCLVMAEKTWLRGSPRRPFKISSSINLAKSGCATLEARRPDASAMLQDKMSRPLGNRHARASSEPIRPSATPICLEPSSTNRLHSTPTAGEAS